MSGRRGWGLGLLVALVLPALAGAQDVERGKVVYEKWCVHCHGVKGDGEGVAASRLDPKPRDFTSGKYKIRMTTTGQLPTDADLHNAIRRGLPYSSMPAFPANFIPDADVDALVAYIKSFSPDFADEERLRARDEATITIPQPPPYDPEQARTEGRQIYVQTGCGACHGNQGRGDGLSAPTLKDDWGHGIRVADLTMPWTFRGGGTRQDIFRTMSTGFYGTPMPGFHNNLGETPEESARRMWAIVDYMMWLAGGPPKEGQEYEAPYSNLLTAVYNENELVLECAGCGEGEADAAASAGEGGDGGAAAASAEVDTSCGRGLFQDAPASMFPLVGQIMEPGRNFHPRVYAITARAVYNDDDVAFLLTWHDMRAETSGANAPDLHAPLWDDELAALGQGPAAGGEGEEDLWGGAADEGGDPWGDAAVDESADPWGDAAVAEGEDVWGDAAAEEGGGDIWGDEETPAAGPSTPQNEFSDAVALQFPLVLPTGIRRPYFLFGDAQNPVEIWFRDLAAAAGAFYVGRGSAALTLADAEPPEMSVSYHEGEWSVIFKRPRKGRGTISFEEDTFVPVAFSVWDGFNRERGNKRSLTGWRYVYLTPREEPAWLGPTLRAMAIVLAVEVLVIFLVRRRSRRRGAAPVQQEQTA